MIEIPKRKFEILKEAVREMDIAWTVADFIENQIDRLLTEYEEYKERKKEFESEDED